MYARRDLAHTGNQVRLVVGMYGWTTDKDPLETRPSALAYIRGYESRHDRGPPTREAIDCEDIGRVT